MIDNCKWVYLLQLLRDPKAGVHLLPPLCVFGLIVFQEVTSGQLSSYEPDQGQVYKQEVHNGLHDHHWFDLTIQECHKYCFCNAMLRSFIKSFTYKEVQLNLCKHIVVG